MERDFVDYTGKSLEYRPEILNFKAIKSRRLRAAMSKFLNRHLHPGLQLTPDQPMVINGTTAAAEQIV
ncbi:hypothetical protein N7507_006155 [Penicillium longicatenatum]|nr:hypothetical protein N7507_006155 [Penicillium longicatenatum]